MKQSRPLLPKADTTLPVLGSATSVLVVAFRSTTRYGTVSEGEVRCLSWYQPLPDRPFWLVALMA